MYQHTLIFISALLIISTSALAEQDKLFELSLKELIQVKITVASRIEEDVIDAPSSVTVITREEIEQLGVRTFVELLNYVPGFQSYMSPQQSNNSLILARGLPEKYGAQLILMIDGHRINDEYTGGFTYADHLMSLHNVKQVEFIRGPGSTLYGSNALAGVINIITLKKQKYARAIVGTNNARGLAAASFGQIGKIEADLALNYYRDDGQSYSNLTDANGFGKSTQDPAEVFEGRLGLNYQRSRFIIEYMNTKLSDYYVLRRIENGLNKNDSSRLGVYLEHDFKLPTRWEGNARIGYMRHERQQQTILSPGDPSSDKWRQDTTEAQADFNYLTQNEHQLSMGASLAYSDIPVATEGFSGDRFILDESRQTIGVYIQDQFDLIDKLRITAGLRYDDYNDFGNTINPRFAMRYNMLAQHAFKFMYGRAYRAPSLGDLYDLENTTSTGNLFLKPVIVNTYELSYIYHKEKNNFILTLFYNDFKDFITTRDTPSGTIFDNLYNNKTTGLELDYRWFFGKNWSTRIGYTHILSREIEALQNVSFADPNQISPRNYGNVDLNYQRQKWNWNINTVWHDGIKVLQDQGSILITNSTLSYQLNTQWKLRANVRNLFDKTYSTPQARVLGQDESGNDIQEMVARSREFFLSVQYQFGQN